MLMTFFELPFLIRGNKAIMTLFAPTTLVFRCSLNSVLSGHQSGEDLACGRYQGTDISVTPFGVLFMIAALLMR